MAVGVVLLERQTDLFEQLAGVAVILELHEALPGDVEWSVAADEVAEVSAARLPVREKGS